MTAAAHVVNWLVVLAFAAAFSYQIIYMVLPWLKKKDGASDDGLQKPRANSYAFFISARDEEAVIGQLIDSIKKQNYTQGRTDVYVVADNCTDHTAEVAKKAGATVYERSDMRHIGKGYALGFLYDCLKQDNRLKDYDGIFIFDADNLLAENYVTEMNRVFGEKYPVVTSFRQSRNIADNWVSYDSGLWFLHDAQYLNRSRMQVGSSCMVSGTGYLISRKLLERAGGWHFFLMTEDIEFNAWCILHKEKIGYCESAVFYDMQPDSFKVSWNQRVRWVKGYFQVYRKNGRQLSYGVRHGLGLSAYDMLMSSMPAFVILLATLIAYAGLVVTGLVTGRDISFVIYSFYMFFIKVTLVLLAFGFYITVSEWKSIPMKGYRKILYTFMFPVFLESYIPITFAALTHKVEWKHIDHISAAMREAQNRA